MNVVRMTGCLSYVSCGSSADTWTVASLSDSQPQQTQAASCIIIYRRLPVQVAERALIKYYVSTVAAIISGGKGT